MTVLKLDNSNHKRVMKMVSVVSTKSFFNYPCSHRQWADKGHCQYLHGYSRSFHFHFVSDSLQEGTGWVQDFGDLKWLKKHLDEMFDHTTLISSKDPHLVTLKNMHSLNIINLRIMKNPSMEGTAKYLFEWINREFEFSKLKANRFVRCFKVEVRENEKNSAIFELPKEAILKLDWEQIETLLSDVAYKDI